MGGCGFDGCISSDDLNDTPDYVVLHQIVVKEMKIPSRLLEHVAQRIIERIKSSVKDLDHIRVRVSKINPPIGGDVQSVSVLLEV